MLRILLKTLLLIYVAINSGILGYNLRSLKKEGYTWVGYLNYCILQFFFIRLCYFPGDERKYGFHIMFPVLPYTGWRKKYLPTKKYRFIIKKED